MASEIIECGHCLTEVKRGANICIGCRAEVRYGLSTSGFFGYLFGVFALIVALQIAILALIEYYGHYVGLDFEALKIWANTDDNYLIVLYANLALTLVLFTFLYIKYIRKSYKDHVTFNRLVRK